MKLKKSLAVPSYFEYALNWVNGLQNVTESDDVVIPWTAFASSQSKTITVDIHQKGCTNFIEIELDILFKQSLSVSQKELFKSSYIPPIPECFCFKRAT